MLKSATKALSEAYLVPRQTSTMEFFAEIVKELSC